MARSSYQKLKDRIKKLEEEKQEYRETLREIVLDTEEGKALAITWRMVFKMQQGIARALEIGSQCNDPKFTGIIAVEKGTIKE